MLSGLHPSLGREWAGCVLKADGVKGLSPMNL